ncbi:HlyD family type I secretion periplasmic adaptor subunit [Devosia chinhatensis]|uniref:Membrane fusion protein (MFP) family protein n=1 Tax=Devosia chinhatensis TaxID=429727 RepID=A0A0F5FNN9_9HYPH|nr:HlyD family type I secretion periplasmic adaptor subunit [Devosia chinhatensis]KKB09802.1 hypothetical protein VE26_08085 [Devosia chinhatensis]
MTIMDAGKPGQGLVPAAITPANDTSAAVSTLSLQKGPLLFGLSALVVFVGVFGVWAGLAPLSSGALASGIVGPDSSRKVIQHLEGGIVSVLHVRQNQQVKAGEPLITLESVQAEASFSAQRSQWARLLIMRERLDAQMDGRSDFSLPEAEQWADNVQLAEFTQSQQQLLSTRQAALKQQSEIHETQIAQLHDEINAIDAENAGLDKQMELMAEEMANKARLLEQQLISQPDYMLLQRQMAQLESSKSANTARIARAAQQINEVRLQMLQLQETYRDRVAEESTQVNNEIAQIEERMASAGDILKRTIITSPVDGIVLNLQAQTTGGVIRPAEPIMEVVPLNDDMIIVARLAPKDIDMVTVGLEARVSLLPFASRNELPLIGSVTEVAADSTYDEASRTYYYEMRVRVSADELAKHEGIYLSPGMPADVTIVTGERTMLQYLAEPLVRSVTRAFVYD